jgi:hypothetical protein
LAQQALSENDHAQAEGILTAEEAANRLDIGVRALQELVKQGRLEVRRVKRGVKRGEPRTFYTAASVERELEYRRQRESGPTVPTNGGLVKREMSIESTRVSQAQADFFSELAKRLAELPAILEKLGCINPPAIAPPLDYCWMRIPDAAKEIGMPESFLREAIADGRLKARIGRVKFADVKALEVA